MKDLVLYIHGKGGSAAESGHYASLFPGCAVVGLDYKTFTPWETGKEIREAVERLCREGNSVTLIANSIGAYFSMCAGIDALIRRAYFISPIVDMERLIRDMMRRAKVSEEELQSRGVIATSFGEDLSWAYLRYVREHPVSWNVPTEILYGSADSMTYRETMEAFAKAHRAGLTVLAGGEHWFHTPEQTAFLDGWIRQSRQTVPEREAVGLRLPAVEFRPYGEEDYEAVCAFLIALNRRDKTHINWNWARFEWMMEHPEFDKKTIRSIGLWREGDRIVAAAIYDMYFGEAFCAALQGYEALYPTILDYAWRELKDASGLGIALCDDSQGEREAAEAAGFAPDAQSETVLRLDLDKLRPRALPEGWAFAELDPAERPEDFQWLLWQGFDHGTDHAEFERSDPIIPRRRPHLNKRLSLAAAAPDGALAAYCCVWYRPDTDYAYVEPVCTVPAYRGKGLAAALLTQALSRAKALGAETAYVISDLPFYEKLGFEPAQHYTFYRKGDGRMDFIGSKILVLGSCGAGKSTFARNLHEITGLPLVHLDLVWWRPDETHIPREEFDRRLEAIISGDRWIIDGDYRRTYEMRIRACDTVFFLDYDEETCLRGLRRRVGQKRPDIPWVEQKLDPELVELARRYKTDSRPKLLALLAQYPEKQTVIFHTRQEADAWLEKQRASGL